MRGAMHSADRARVGPVGRRAPDRAAVRRAAFLRQGAHSRRGTGLGQRIRSARVAPSRPSRTPSLVFDSFLAWLAVSLVLSLTRVLTGNIAAAIGLHAGWVVVLRMLQEAQRRAGRRRHRPGSADSTALLGYWVVPWSAAIAFALWLTRGSWVPYCAAAPAEASRSRRSQRIVEFQIGLLVGERNRQYLGEPVHPPRPHRRGACRCARTPRRAAAAPCQQLGQPCVARGHRQRAGSSAQPVDLAYVQPIGLAAAPDNAKPPPPDAGQSEQTVRQLVKIGDLRQRADIVQLGVLPARPRGPRGSAPPRSRCSSRMQRRTMS